MMKTEARPPVTPKHAAVIAHVVAAPAAPPPAPPPRPPNPPKPPISVNPRRSEAERLRHLGTSTLADAALTPDGHLFAQLILPVDGRSGQPELAGGSAIASQAHEDAAPSELVDALGAKLASQPLTHLDLAMLMPTLGPVQVRASPDNGQWHVELGFARSDVYRRLKPRERNCADTLSAALGCAVCVSMLDEARP